MFTLLLIAALLHSAFGGVGLYMVIEGILNKDGWRILFYLFAFIFNLAITYLHATRLIFMYRTLEWALSL